MIRGKNVATDVDLVSPIGVNQVSNMLHVMTGLPPVPSKRPSIFTRNEVIYDLALNHSYIKYDGIDSITFKNGVKKHMETMFQSNKGNWDSNAKIYTTICGIDFPGRIDWESLIHMFFRDGTKFSATKYKVRKFDVGRFELVFGLFNEILECDDVTNDYPKFEDFLIEFWKHLDDERVVRFKKEHGKDLWGSRTSILGVYGLYKLIFYADLDIESKTGGITCCKSEHPILNTNGIKKKVTYSGELIIEIEDDNTITMLKEHGQLPTILDGGVITVLGLKKLPPRFDFKDEFIKISL